MAAHVSVRRRTTSGLTKQVSNLLTALGQAENFGVFAEVIEGGEVALGDPAALEGGA